MDRALRSQPASVPARAGSAGYSSDYSSPAVQGRRDMPEGDAGRQFRSQIGDGAIHLLGNVETMHY